MKWYNVKKYIPPKNSGSCLIANTWGDLFVAVPRFNIDGNIEKWISNEKIEIQYCNITHFCIPDPIEIEE